MFKISLIFLVIFIYYTNAYDYSFGEHTQGQELLWVQYAYVPVQQEKGNLTVDLKFDGRDKNVQNITIVTFDCETVSSDCF